MFSRPKPDPVQEGQESVWDYPRPPRVEPTSRRLVVRFNGRTIADTSRGKRVLETSHPPVYYFPEDDVDASCLERCESSTNCEWKGAATYYDVVVGDRRSERAAFSYENPVGSGVSVRGMIAFYAGLVDECTVDGVKAEPQPGGFYAGWITPDLAGPFKGGPGSAGW